MRRSILILMTSTLFAAPVFAQGDPIAARKAVMKDVGAQSRTGAAIAKGEEPFDLAKSRAVLAALASNADKAGPLFTETSKTGDTAAAPAIWENKADFDAKMKKMSADAKAGESSVKDLASFQAAFTNVGQSCGGCHQTYRLRRN